MRNMLKQFRVVAIACLSLTVFIFLVMGEFIAAGVWFIALVLVGEEK